MDAYGLSLWAALLPPSPSPLAAWTPMDAYGRLWISYGFPMDSLWISYGFQRISMDSYGFPMEFLWISYGFPMDSQWIPMDFLWIPMDFLWISDGFL